MTPLTSTLLNRYVLPEKPPTRRRASMRWLTFFIWSSMSPSACIDSEYLAHVTPGAPKKRKRAQNKVEKRYGTWFTTGSNTSRRRRFPGMESSPLNKPTWGSSGSSTLKHVKLNIKSGQKGIKRRRCENDGISRTVLLLASVHDFLCLTE